MTADIVQANYEQLDAITQSFSGAADDMTTLREWMSRGFEPLEQGAWQGQGSQAFTNEMRGAVFPALDRLIVAFQTASSVTTQISALMHAAEEEAAAPFRQRGSQAEAAGKTLQAPSNQPPPPLTDKQQEMLDKTNAMISNARFFGATMSPNHLQHWLDGSGAPIIYPASDFKDLSST
ncbi:MAG: WXG100 family type VII secretion target, partial [Chloroflexota bacterium]|nr:WXG100 family type VII secretion target [Chloroflexota bacterium]